MNKNYKSFLRTVHQKRYSRIFCVFVCFLLYDYLQGFHPSYIVLYFVCMIQKVGQDKDVMGEVYKTHEAIQ